MKHWLIEYACAHLHVKCNGGAGRSVSLASPMDKMPLKNSKKKNPKDIKKKTIYIYKSDFFK